jgi:hypothetical protein
MQFTLDFEGKFPPATQEKIRAGMKQADDNADVRWKAVLDGCVLAVARRQEELTSDDVLAELESLPHHPVTHNLAAIGPAMKRAAQMGIITRTDRFMRSTVAHKNGNLHAIWKSNYAANARAERDLIASGAIKPLETKP